MTAALAAQVEFRHVLDVVVPDIRTRARARLGRTVLSERKAQGKTQQQAADDLHVVVEQVRRYEAEWRDWQKQHPGEEP
jgi:hypothetical protein